MVASFLTSYLFFIPKMGLTLSISSAGLIGHYGGCDCLSGYQSQCLTRLIEEMLDVTRIENMRLLLHLAEHDLISTIRGVVDTQAATATQHQLSFALDGPQATETLIGSFDESRIAQVLNNLLSNAIKYSHAGSEIEVGLRRITGTVGEALFWVKVVLFLQQNSTEKRHNQYNP